MDLEQIIEMANQYYIDNDIAYIYKKPTPIGVTKVDYNIKGKRIHDLVFPKIILYESFHAFIEQPNLL